MPQRVNPAGIIDRRYSPGSHKVFATDSGGNTNWVDYTAVAAPIVTITGAGNDPNSLGTAGPSVGTQICLNTSDGNHWFWAGSTYGWLPF
jgi:hypothetical protein